MFLTLLATLVLDAPAPTVAVTADCFVLDQCRVDRANVGEVRVAVVFDQWDADETFATVAISLDDEKVTYFDAGLVASSTAHMSEDRDLEDYDHAHVTAGTLADGTAAAVIRLDWRHQDYREGNRGHGLETVWTGRSQKRADVVVCALGDAPACSKPVRVDGRPRVSLRAGTLRVGRARYQLR